MPLWEKAKSVIFGRLWVQMWLVMSLLVAILITFLGVLLVRTSEKGVSTTLLRDHREIALRAAQEINLFINSPREILETAAQLVGISHTDPWKHETLLVELGLRFPIFSRISSVSLQGEDLASSAPGTPKIDFSKNEVVRRALLGEPAFSSVAISKEGIPSMEIAVPYRNLGKMAGVLCAEVSLRGMWEIVDHIQIGKTGFAYLVSADGTVVAHQDKKRVLKNVNLAAASPVRRALAGENGSEIFKAERTKVLAAFAPVGKLGWGLVTQQDWNEAFSFAKTMTAQSRIFIAASLIVSILVSVLLAIAISRPVKQLALSADEVAQGNLDIELATNRKDEIGNLIRHFSNMIAQLKKAKDWERLSAMGMAAARIAHELRNPLVAIKTYTQLFSSRKQEPSFLNRFESTVPPEIDRLERMLEELGDFARAQRLKFTNVSLPVVLDETLLLLKEKLDQQKIAVHRIDSSDDKFVVWGDRERLKQVFINLVANAATAMENGGLLSLNLSRQDSFVSVKVMDTGKGIPPEDLPKLFEPFHTTRKGGMGLGLTICRNIIEQHQGKIEVSSRLNSGTAFVVSLPIKK